jgi:hypothetical protein
MAMKKLLIILALLITINLFAQPKHILFKSGLCFVSGFSDGLAESIKFHNIFPNSNYWNLNNSWGNKYKNGNSADGAKFIGSTTFLVWTTDGYHLMRMIRNISLMSALTINVCSKQKWYTQIINGVIYYIVYNIAFNISYGVIFKTR